MPEFVLPDEADHCPHCEGILTEPPRCCNRMMEEHSLWLNQQHDEHDEYLEREHKQAKRDVSEDEHADLYRHYKEREQDPVQQAFDAVNVEPMQPAKYGTEDLFKALMSKLHPGEPFFIVRGQDVHSVAALEAYHDSLIESDRADYAKEIWQIIRGWEEWQKKNSEKVKEPD